ncbi:hypothetical protein F2Q70_00013014 [Brassica cretica]|uniref:Uncharacterized protein n=1 Tax=Brassica cretica TaxID=69181 RepID=A0A8S9M5F0_BRACR|nr:hypothetical protein F2Q70_00013014 [Brassica cretica]
MNDVEVREAYQQRRYPFQFRRKAWPGEVPLSLLLALYSLSQSSGMLNVEACSPLPTAVLLPPNARLIHVE